MTWEQRLASGDHLAVVEDAEKLGLPDVLATRPLVDLKALADASRYAGRTHVAEQTLQAMRKRFEGSSAAHMAAFELGRLLDDGRRDPGRAADWYARYLGEAPSGPLAEEALVRLMVARVRQGEQAQAEAAARRYLQMYPEGSRAGLAKQVAAGKATGR